MTAACFGAQTAKAEDAPSVAVWVPHTKGACAQELPRILALELERFGVRAIFGEPVASARRHALEVGPTRHVLAEAGRILGVEYVLAVTARRSGAGCRARGELIDAARERVWWSWETRYSSRDAEAKVRTMAVKAAGELFLRRPAVRQPPLTDFVRVPIAVTPVVQPVIAESAIAEVAGQPMQPMQSMGVEEQRFEDKVHLELRGLLSGANAFEHQPALDRVDYNRKRAHGSLTLRGMMRVESGDEAELEVHVLQSLTVASQDPSPFSLAYTDDRAEAQRFAGLAYKWAGGANESADIAVDRLKLRFSMPNVDFTIGRQPINLGTTFYFTPNDFFVPFAADALFRVYKPGVDSGRVDVQLGELSTFSMIAVLGYEHAPYAEPLAKDPVTWDKSALLVTTSFSANDFNFKALAGKIPQALAIGGSVEGEVFEWLGVHAEGHYAVPFGEREHRVELAIALEHRFESSLHLRLEHFIHGSGGSRINNFARAFRESLGTIPYLARNLTAFGAGYELTPLLKVDALAILSWGDFSGAASLSLGYSVFENGEIVAMGRLPWGASPDARPDPSGNIRPSPASEFGFSPMAINVDFRIFF